MGCLSQPQAVSRSKFRSQLWVLVMKMGLFYTTELLVGSFPGKLSEEQVVSPGIMKRGSAEGPETSQQEGSKWQRCLQGKREGGLQRAMTSAKCSEEKQLGKEDHSYRCVRDGSKIIQLGSSSNGRLFISTIHSLPWQLLFKHCSHGLRCPCPRQGAGLDGL